MSVTLLHQIVGQLQEQLHFLTRFLRRDFEFIVLFEKVLGFLECGSNIGVC
jgi:hypothetical protein